MKRYFKHIRSTMQEALADIHIGKLNQRNHQLTKDQLQIIQSQVEEIEDELCTSADCLEKVKKQIVAERRQWITEKNIRSREQVLKEFFKDDNIAKNICMFNFISTKALRWTILRNLQSEKAKHEFKIKRLEEARINWRKDPFKELMYLHMRTPF